jgi:hypothetical protein
MTWCNDPDKAFDLKCESLMCEDFCHDDSECILKRKDSKMDKSTFVSIKRVMTTEEIATSDVVIQITSDKKGFYVIKHRHMYGVQGEKYHISDLPNILLADNR